jgi:predicted ester cyclase
MPLSRACVEQLVILVHAGNNSKFGVGRESFRLQWRKQRDAFPDVNFAVEEIIAEGNTVVTR